MSDVSQLSQSPQSTDYTALDLLAQMIVQATGVSLERMRGRQKTKATIEARKLFCELADECGYSSKAIGRFICRDHTTVLHHLKKKESPLLTGGEDELALSGLDEVISLNYPLTPPSFKKME